MESLDELSKTSSGKGGFFKHVFNFDQSSKNEMLNIIQYAVLAIIPVVIINKLMQRYIPEADDEKGSLELSAEIIAQIIVMFLAILIIHRIITYIPTYSEEKYVDFSVTNIVLAMLVIVLSLQTKLGEKVSILVDRLLELWNGSSSDKKSKKSSVKVSQPISQPQTMGSTAISSLPTQQMPSFDQMYQTDSTPLIGATTPGVDSFVPSAANDAVGAFGSVFGGW
jgi:hypothetical protein